MPRTASRAEDRLSGTEESGQDGDGDAGISPIQDLGAIQDRMFSGPYLVCVVDPLAAPGLEVCAENDHAPGQGLADCWFTIGGGLGSSATWGLVMDTPGCNVMTHGLLQCYSQFRQCEI